MAFWNKQIKKETEEKIDALTLPKLTISGNMQELKTNMMSPISDMALQCEVNGVIIGADLDSSKGMPNLGTSVEDVTEPDEYIWVEGYKGMDADMKCTYYHYGSLALRPRSTQYKLNEEVSLSDEDQEKLCCNGFHFCLKLKDVFWYYAFNGKNRFFKVKAYVNKKDYQKWVEEQAEKCVARKMIPYEEIIIDYELAKQAQKEVLLWDYGKYSYTLTEQDFNAIYVEKQHPIEYFKEEFVKVMYNLNWGPKFAAILWLQFFSADEVRSIAKLFAITKMIAAFEEEGLSKDTITISIFSQF